MANKRLLAILIVFIVLGGLAIAGGTIFVVRNVEIEFANTLEYLADESEVIRTRLHTAASNVVHGSNSIFGVNRARIEQAIEDEDFRVHVTNIEVIFPNRIIIKVRERYPVFHFRHGNDQYILCRQLRFITRSITPERELVNIPSDQIRVTEATRVLELGMHLDDFFPPDERGYISTHYMEERMKIQRMRDVTDFFFSRDNYEDAISHLFTSVEFVDSGANRVDMRLTWHATNTLVIIQNIYNQENFIEMLHYVMYVKEVETNNMARIYTVRIGLDGRLLVVPTWPT